MKTATDEGRYPPILGLTVLAAGVLLTVKSRRFKEESPAINQTHS